MGGGRGRWRGELGKRGQRKGEREGEGEEEAAWAQGRQEDAVGSIGLRLPEAEVRDGESWERAARHFQSHWQAFWKGKP